MILHSHHELLAKSRAEPTRFWDHFETPPAHLWIETARTSPPLARALAAAVNRANASSHAVDTWPLQFVSSPPWADVELELRQVVPGEVAEEANILKLAKFAESIAAHTGWCDARTAFWTALCHTASFEPVSGALDTLPGSHRARIVAGWLLNDLAEGTASAHWPSLPGLPSEHAVDLLIALQPEHDWPAIAEEARHLVSEPTEVDLLTAPRQQLLVSWARQAALEEELSLRTDVYQLTLLNDSESLLRQSVAILRRTTTQPVALWVSPNFAGLPQGLGAVSAWTQGSRYLPAALSGGDRDAFERTLPGSLRSSREYRSETGDVAAIVYFDSRVTAWTLRWSETIMQVLQSHSQRARGPEVASALRSPQSVAAAMAHVERELLEAIAEFSAGAGHEINNPLGAILGQAQWLLQEEVDPKRRHCLQKIADQVGRIRRMIRDLRLIGRPTAPRVHQVPLADCLSQAVAAASKRIAGPSLCLEDRGLAVIVSGVAEEISRAIEELVVNAMEAAGPNGQVTVRQSLSGADVVIDVIDSGSGFTVESRRHAYTPFYSGRTAGRGLGMGLAVAKRIVSDFGGRLTIFRTRPTKVRISFPIAESCRNAA